MPGCPHVDELDVVEVAVGDGLVHLLILVDAVPEVLQRLLPAVTTSLAQTLLKTLRAHLSSHPTKILQLPTLTLHLKSHSTKMLTSLPSPVHHSFHPTKMLSLRSFHSTKMLYLRTLSSTS